MDDILASIRKIISDDEARAQVRAGAGSPAPASAAAAAGRQARRRAAAHRPGRGAAEGAVRRPIPLPPPRIDPVSAAEMPQPSVGGLPSRLGRLLWRLP